MSEASERRLLLFAAGEWLGWVCDHCGWNQRVGVDQQARGQLELEICLEFDSHDCAEFSGKTSELPLLSRA